tara:strand:+ start:2740 stop:2877 length:138 start_codon:yes stop_codon:yes gene_type:complete
MNYTHHNFWNHIAHYKQGISPLLPLFDDPLPVLCILPYNNNSMFT